MPKKEVKVSKKLTTPEKKYRIYKIKSIHYRDPQNMVYGTNREEPYYEEIEGRTLILPSTYILSEGYPMFVLYYQDNQGNPLLGKAIKTSPVVKATYVEDNIDNLIVETENSVYILELAGEIRKKEEKQKIDYMLSWMCDTFRWVCSWNIEPVEEKKKKKKGGK